MQQALLFLLAIFAGVMLPIQAGLNSEIGRTVKSPVFAALISFLVGTIGLVLFLLATRASWANVKNGFQLPWYYWTGGLMGAVYVVAIIMLAPRLGVALTFGLTVAAQMLLSIVLDHYGWLGLPTAPINWARVLGVILVIGGVVLIRAN